VEHSLRAQNGAKKKKRVFGGKTVQDRPTKGVNGEKKKKKNARKKKCFDHRRVARVG